MTFSLIGTVVDVITTVLRVAGLPGLFALMAFESFGLPPLPSEVILPFAGFLVATGDFAFGPAVAVALAGALVGAYAAYAVGRWYRSRLTQIGIGPIRLEERHLARMDRWFLQHGQATVGLARLVPVVRSYISYPAGTSRMDPARFGLYTLLGCIPFTLAFMYAGYVLGRHWTVVEEDLRYLDYAVYVAIVAFLLYLVVRLYPHRRAAREPPAHDASPEGPGSPPPIG